MLPPPHSSSLPAATGKQRAGHAVLVSGAWQDAVRAASTAEHTSGLVDSAVPIRRPDTVVRLRAGGPAQHSGVKVQASMVAHRTQHALWVRDEILGQHDDGLPPAWLAVTAHAPRRRVTAAFADVQRRSCWQVR